MSESAHHDESITSLERRGERDDERPAGADATEAESGSAGSFGRLSPSEAGKRSGEARRAKREAEAEAREREADEQARALDDRESDLAIIARLRRDAATGDTRAARELRAWLDSVKGQGDAEDWQRMSPARQALFEDWLIAEEREEAGIAASPRLAEV